MNFLGVGPGEVLFILVLALVALGPERLPVFARQAGRFVVGVRNWVQRSPDAAMVLRVRRELEEELDEIRRSLTQEMNAVRDDLNSVRDDLVDASRSFEDAADSVAKTKIELEFDEFGGVKYPDAPIDASIAPPVTQSSVTEVAADVAEALPTDETVDLAMEAAEGLMPQVPQVADDLSAFVADPGPIGERQRRIAEREALLASEDAVPTIAPPVNGVPVARAKPDYTGNAASRAEVDALSARLDTLISEVASLRAQIAAAAAEPIPVTPEEVA